MSVRIIPTQIHGALDHPTSGVNLALSTVLGPGDAPRASLVPLLVGGAGTAYGLITGYELGAL